MENVLLTEGRKKKNGGKRCGIIWWSSIILGVSELGVELRVVQ